MTRQEAIQRLKNTAWLGTNKDREETEKAVNMAIEALSEPSKTDETYICDTCKHKGKPWHSEECDGCTGADSNYEPTDLISRQAAIEYLVTNMGWHDEDGYSVDDTDGKRKAITELLKGVPSIPRQGLWWENCKPKSWDRHIVLKEDELISKGRLLSWLADMQMSTDPHTDKGQLEWETLEQVFQYVEDMKGEEEC